MIYAANSKELRPAVNERGPVSGNLHALNEIHVGISEVESYGSPAPVRCTLALPPDVSKVRAWPRGQALAGLRRWHEGCGGPLRPFKGTI